MSFVHDHVKDIDAQLDRLQFASLHSDSVQSTFSRKDAQNPETTSRLNHLHSLIKLLSFSSVARPSLSQAGVVIGALKQSGLLSSYPSDYYSSGATATSYEHELQWFLIAKATAQTYGLLLEALTRQTLPLNQELWYWNDVVGSYRYTALYSIQTSPIRFWSWSKSVYHEARDRGDIVKDGWKEFYGLVRTVVRERSIADVQRRALSPLAEARTEIQRKQNALHRAKSLNASGIGYLLSNGLNTGGLHNSTLTTISQSTSPQSSNRWQSVVFANIFVMHAVCNAAVSPDIDVTRFESTIGQYIKDDQPENHQSYFTPGSDSIKAADTQLDPSEAATRLLHVLEEHLPAFVDHSEAIMKRNSRPSRLVRYWLPGVALLLSSTTILRIVVNRKAEIIQWVRDLGETTLDFWNNWVVEPVKNVIGTIRHDESSEISIISKQSLKGDRDSLVRMVTDFAVDNPDGPALSEVQVAEIRSAVSEGDLTPVLKAYEKDLQHPFWGSVRGNLIRALLIQIQKTKVDVEVAMGGIDSLLKSQQLVFGFVGLTPGVLVCIGVFRWLKNLSSRRGSLRRGRKQSESVETLRQIDRILTNSPQSGTGVLSFEEYGLLVCEAIVLREFARKGFTKQEFQEFLQDFQDLIDNGKGVGRQIRVVDRIRWAYSRSL